MSVQLKRSSTMYLRSKEHNNMVIGVPLDAKGNTLTFHYDLGDEWVRVKTFDALCANEITSTGGIFLTLEQLEEEYELLRDQHQYEV